MYSPTIASTDTLAPDATRNFTASTCERERRCKEKVVLLQFVCAWVVCVWWCACVRGAGRGRGGREGEDVSSRLDDAGEGRRKEGSVFGEVGAGKGGRKGEELMHFLPIFVF